MAHDGADRNVARKRLELGAKIKIEGLACRARQHQSQARPAKRERRLFARNRPGRAQPHRQAVVAGRKNSGGTARFLSFQNPAPDTASEEHLRLKHSQLMETKKIRVRPAGNCPLCRAPGEMLYEGVKDVSSAAPGEWNFRRCAVRNCGMVW